MKQSGVFYLLASDWRSYSFFFRFAFDFGLENWRNGPLAQKSNIQSKSKKSIYGTWLSCQRANQYQVPRSNGPLHDCDHVTNFR